MKVITYVKTGCRWCMGVTKFLKEKGIAHEEKNVTDSKGNFDEMIRVSGQTKAPVVMIDEEVLADTDAESVERYLREKGLL